VQTSVIDQKIRNRQRWLIGGFLVVSVGLCLWLWTRFQTPPPKVIILPWEEAKPSRGYRLIQNGWQWLRLRVFGPGRDILLNVTILKLDGLVNGSNAPLAAADFSSTSGLQVWVLPEDQLRTTRGRLEQLPGSEVVSRPRIQTASGFEAAMSVGQTLFIDGAKRDVGLNLNYIPKLRSDHVEIASRLLFTEARLTPPVSLATNLAIRSRIRLANGCGALLVTRGADGKSTAITLSVNVK
jgi:hypothetical protein